jgi:hypothetical protein
VTRIDLGELARSDQTERGNAHKCATQKRCREYYTQWCKP